MNPLTLAKRTSYKPVKINSPSNPFRNSSTALIKEDNTVNSELLKTNLTEFYKHSKEKLLKLKGEIQSIELENEKQKEENIKLGLRSLELQNTNEELTLRIKGAKEKLVAAHKHKSGVQTHIRETKKEIESTTRKIDTMKIDTNYKVKMIQNEIDHTNVVKENNVKSLKKKIENEENHKQELNEKINEINTEILKYKILIDELNQNDSMRSKQLNKETAEMTKFLSEL